MDYRKNISIIALVQKGGHKEIMGIGTYAQESDTHAEAAFVVREDFQGLGVGSYLLQELERIARENHLKGFTATVLRENSAMIHVFKKRYPWAKKAGGYSGEISLIMDFDEPK